MRKLRFPQTAFLLVAAMLPVASAFADGGTTLHFAFSGTPTNDRPVVTLPGVYTKETGYGFADAAGLKANDKGVQGERFFRFDAALADGSYDVTATVGSPLVDSVTTIRSEEHRLMRADIATKANEFREVTFTVNIHKDVANKTELNSDGRLHLEFIGQNPSITKLDIKPNTTAPVLYMVGDSTMCDYNSDPRFGWGQMFPAFFKTGDIAVCNCSKSGRTAKSFMAEKRLDDILKIIKPGDYMFIQFAHNDMKDTSLTPDSWKALLMNFIDGARTRKAFPVLVTSMPRRQFDTDGKIKNSLGDFPETMRTLAKEQSIPLIDLNARATDFFNILGSEGSTKAFCHYPGGMYTGFPNNNMDNTHFNPYGAYELAKIVAREIKAQKMDLASHIVDDLEPVNTDPTKFSVDVAFNPLLVKQ